MNRSTILCLQTQSWSQPFTSVGEAALTIPVRNPGASGRLGVRGQAANGERQFNSRRARYTYGPSVIEASLPEKEYVALAPRRC